MYDRENFFPICCVVLTGSFEKNGDNHTIHTEHTSHDNGNDRSEEELGLEDGDGDDTDT